MRCEVLATTTVKRFQEKLVNASWLTSFDRLVHLRMLMSGGLINIKTCCIGLERTHLIWDAEYMVRPELAAPASPLWPQWQWKDDRVIGQRTFRDREINSQHTRHGQSSTDWRDGLAQWVLTIFPDKTFAESWRYKSSLISLPHRFSWPRFLRKARVKEFVCRLCTKWIIFPYVQPPFWSPKWSEMESAIKISS